MFNLFSKPKKRTKCIVLYNFDFNRNSTKELFELLINYFTTKHTIDFRYLGFYDERYADKYGKFETIYPKLQQAKWNEIVNFSLDVENLRDKKRSISVEFNITRPKHITVVLPEDFEFDIIDFVKAVNSLYKTRYGFSYFTKDNEWATAYAIGNREHSKPVTNITRLTTSHFDHWRNDCEKISAGRLRDVYEENILTQVHLSYSVNYKNLKGYIESEKMGELLPIDNNTFLWKLNNSQLKQTRAFLYNTTIVIGNNAPH